MLLPLHGIASRHDLPLPFSFVVVGAVLALTISFVILIFAWRKPRFDQVGGRPMPRVTAVVDHPITRLVARAVVLAAYVWAGLAMMAGQDLLTNPIFGFVFVWMWVGLVPDLAVTRSVLASNQPAADNPRRPVRTGTR